MNGRALNEKAIEVSPSSARVLDRAADMLMPFPPSKNRPRPGDWNCPSCGFSNFRAGLLASDARILLWADHHMVQTRIWGTAVGMDMVTT